MTKMNSFVKQFAAKLKGDDVEVQAQKAWRGAESALKVHIAALEGDVIEKEDDVANAREALDNARINNGTPIIDRNDYVVNLYTAQSALEDAEEELANHLESLDFLKEQYKALSTAE